MENRKRNILIFIGTLILAGIFTVLNAFFNKGTIVLKGEYPFTVDVQDEHVECISDPCEVKLMKGDYELTAKKTDYFDVVNKVSVKRGKTEIMVMNFQYIPVVKELGSRIRYQVGPDLYNPSLTELRTGDVVEVRPLPNNYDEAELASSGEIAAFLYDNSVSTLDVLKGELKKQNFGKVRAMKFAPHSNVLYYLADAKPDDKNRAEAVLYSFSEGKNEKKSFFTEPFLNPEIFTLDDEHAVYIYERDTGDFYEVNLLEGVRKKLTTMQNVEDVIVSPDGKKILLGRKFLENSLPEGYYNYTLLGNESLSFVSSIGCVVFKNNEELLYSTFDVSNPLDNVDILSGAKSRIMKLTMQDGDTKEMFKHDAVVDKLERDENGEILFGSDRKYYEVKLEKGE